MENKRQQKQIITNNPAKKSGKRMKNNIPVPINTIQNGLSDQNHLKTENNNLLIKHRQSPALKDNRQFQSPQKTSFQTGQKSNPCSERSIGEKEIDISNQDQGDSNHEIPSQRAELSESRNPNLLPRVDGPVPLYQINNKDQIISNTRTAKNYDKEKSASTNVHSLAGSQPINVQQNKNHSMQFLQHQNFGVINNETKIYETISDQKRNLAENFKKKKIMENQMILNNNEGEYENSYLSQHHANQNNHLILNTQWPEGGQAEELENSNEAAPNKTPLSIQSKGDYCQYLNQNNNHNLQTQAKDYQIKSVQEENSYSIDDREIQWGKFKQSLSPNPQVSKEIYMLDRKDFSQVGNLFNARKVSQSLTRGARSGRVSHISGQSGKERHQSFAAIDSLQGSNAKNKQSIQKLNQKKNRKSVGQILAQGLKQANGVQQYSDQKMNVSQIQKQNPNLLVNKVINRKQSTILVNSKTTQSRNTNGQSSSQTFENGQFDKMEGKRISTANAVSGTGQLIGKFRKRSYINDDESHQPQQPLMSASQIMRNMNKMKNPPQTAHLQNGKAFQIQNQLGLNQNVENTTSGFGSSISGRRQRMKKKQILTTDGIPDAVIKKTQHNTINQMESKLKQMPSQAQNQRDAAQHSPELEQKRAQKEGDYLKMAAQSLPKTAQSLPRRVQNTFISNIANKPAINMSMTNNNYMNLELLKNKNGTVKPYTGVDQAFLLKRPIHTRQCMDIKEKLNELTYKMVSNHVNSLNSKTVMFDKNKTKSVYDCFYSMNQPFEDRDVRLYVPAHIRKQNGAHINEKVSKYYDKLGQFYTPTGPSDTTLIFESRFESGNLGRATQVGEFVYDLELRPDFASFNQAMTQWYYFRIQNNRKNVEYTFNIINLFKPDSSYNQGMKPLIYSEKNVQTTGNGWYRNGHDIQYFKTPEKVQKISGNEQTTYTLSFKINFIYENDTIYIAHCFPYTYSDLGNFLNRVCNPQLTKDRLKRTMLTRSIAGNPLDMLIITNLESSQDDIAERPAIILSSRVHPGESNASFIMEGIIDFLMSKDPDACALRDKYVFKIVPMLNPDGVITGNYRCSLGGYDLNRQWLNPTMKASPEIYALKDMIKKTLECRKIELFVDIHGHSRQKNLFIYGCSRQQNGPHTQGTLNPNPVIQNPQSTKTTKGALIPNGVVGNGITNLSLQCLTTKEKTFPWILNKNCDDFSFHCCMFGVHKSKESTGRVVVWKEFNIQNSYTLESSFCGPTDGYNKDCHFSMKNLINMGRIFARTILEYSNVKIQKFAQQQIEQFYKAGGGAIPPWLLDKDGNKKGEKEASKNLQKIENVPQVKQNQKNVALTSNITSKQKNGIHLDPIQKPKVKPQTLEHKQNLGESPNKDYQSRRRTITAQAGIDEQVDQLMSKQLQKKQMRGTQMSRLFETKKLKRSDNSESFRELNQHTMLLAAGAEISDTPDSQHRVFGSTTDGTLTDMLKSNKTNNCRVLNIIQTTKQQYKQPPMTTQGHSRDKSNQKFYTNKKTEQQMMQIGGATSCMTTGNNSIAGQTLMQKHLGQIQQTIPATSQNSRKQKKEKRKQEGVQKNVVQQNQKLRKIQ